MLKKFVQETCKSSLKRLKRIPYQPASYPE